MKKSIELIVRQLLELLVRNIKRKSWSSGRLPFEEASIVVFHSIDDDSGANKITAALFKTGAKVHLKTLSNQTADAEIELEMRKVTEPAWVAILLVPDGGWSDGIVNAFHTLTRRRTDLVTIVAGYHLHVGGILSRYEYFQLREKTLAQRLMKSLTKAALMRVQHNRIMDRYSITLFSSFLLLACIIVGFVAYQFAPLQERTSVESEVLDRAWNNLMHLEQIHTAILSIQDTNTKKLLKSANGDVASANLPLSDFEIITEKESGQLEHNFRLIGVEYIDYLEELNHVQGTLCRKCEEIPGGERTLVEQGRRKFLGYVPEEEKDKMESAWKFIHAQIPSLCNEAAGSMFVPVLASIELRSKTSGKYSVTGILAHDAFSIDDRKILIVTKNSSVTYEGKKLFSVQALNRTPSRRPCRIDTRHPLD